VKKPREETWVAEEELLVDEYGHTEPAGWWIVTAEREGRSNCVADCIGERTAKLVAKAPEMARLLLKFIEAAPADASLQAELSTEASCLLSEAGVFE
jgi:hypothetical protein